MFFNFGLEYYRIDEDDDNFKLGFILIPYIEWKIEPSIEWTDFIFELLDETNIKLATLDYLWSSADEANVLTFFNCFLFAY